jgi:hypothetical protein
MHVIGHQAIGPKRQAVVPATGGQVAEIGAVVGSREKDVLAATAALGDVVGQAWHHDAGLSGHGGIPYAIALLPKPMKGPEPNSGELAKKNAAGYEIGSLFQAAAMPHCSKIPKKPMTS